MGSTIFTGALLDKNCGSPAPYVGGRESESKEGVSLKGTSCVMYPMLGGIDDSGGAQVLQLVQPIAGAKEDCPEQCILKPVAGDMGCLRGCSVLRQKGLCATNDSHGAGMNVWEGGTWYLDMALFALNGIGLSFGRESELPMCLYILSGSMQNW